MTGSLVYRRYSFAENVQLSVKMLSINALLLLQKLVYESTYCLKSFEIVDTFYDCNPNSHHCNPKSKVTVTPLLVRMRRRM